MEQVRNTNAGHSADREGAPRRFAPGARVPAPACAAEVETFCRKAYEAGKNVMGALTMNMCVEGS